MVCYLSLQSQVKQYLSIWTNIRLLSINTTNHGTQQQIQQSHTKEHSCNMSYKYTSYKTTTKLSALLPPQLSHTTCRIEIYFNMIDSLYKCTANKITKHMISKLTSTENLIHCSSSQPMVHHSQHELSCWNLRLRAIHGHHFMTVPIVLTS